MANKFTDKAAEHEKPKKTAAAKPAPEKAAEALEPAHEPIAPSATHVPGPDGYLPGMAHEKPEPKPRGCKKAFG